MRSSLASYVARRLVWTLPTLLLVALLVFVLMRLIPGDPALLILGDAATPEQLASLRAHYGLDRPVVTQFAYWLARVAQGDFGTSITSGQPVLPLLLERFQVSASIVLAAVAAAVLLAVPAGLYAAWKQNSVVDTMVVAAATFFLSIPSFWLGLLLLLVVGLKLGLVPVVGYVTFAEDWRAAITFLILPVVTLTLIELGVLTRMARASAIETLRLEYVTHARAKGLSELRVLLRHVLPNAFAPTWTLVGLVLGNLLGGIAVLETVFTLPGLGRLLVDGIFARDYPVVQGCLLFTAFIYVTVNLVVDLCYPLFDPRVSAE
ncbi:MAG TPA: ABC transporter permease [Ramlibacter sp.]|uniref:ABC transporter permease n=1 Tax=Ramlibacter sp. TaxID=1917967 RepID=UPI002C71A2D9|nr:ABC transporter permease [Ramlibacter sp.]HVZ44469.1 ABC transporter permease [Ramlibacter sp.]